MKTIVVNGANGYVASGFINKLLGMDYLVTALVRASNRYSSEERMRNALFEINDGEYVNPSNLKVYNYTLLEDNFSIPEKQLANIFKGDVDYFHFAASLKFDSKSRNEIFKTNVEGVENSIKVFLKFATKRSRFFFISTAYSCGKFTGKFVENFYDGEDISYFRNYYEQSKRYAENVIRKHIEQNNLNAYIIRPSQIVGNNQTGITKTDFGIFNFAKRISNIAYRYPHNTIRIQASGASTQNLIPIDTLVSYLTQAINAIQLPTIMNFVAKESIKNYQIIKIISDNLPINIQLIPHLDKTSLSPIEKLVDIGMSFTGGYCNTNIEFSTENLDKFMKPGNSCITLDSLEKMLKYFLDNYLKEKRWTKIPVLF